MKSLIQYLSESKTNATIEKLVRFLIGDNPIKAEYLETDDVFFDLAENLTNGDMNELAKWIVDHSKDKVSVEYSKEGELWSMMFTIAGCELETEVTERPTFK